MVSQISILLVSEDSADDAIPVLKAIVKKMIYLIDGNFKESSRTFEPLASQEARYISHGHLWKSKDKRDWPKQIAFIRALATKLAEGETSFIFFHVDGDRAWETSENGTVCDHVEPFRRFIAERVSHVVSVRPNSQNTAEAFKEAFHARTLFIIPFYSIESWLYQNTAMGLELSKKHYQGRDATRFETWAQNPALLDEEIKPKEIICFGSKHNRALAESGFPSSKLYNVVNKSFTRCVDTLLMCEKFTKALTQEG